MADTMRQRFDNVLNAIDGETNRIAQAIEDLKTTVANSGMDSASEEEIVGKLDSLKTRLQGIAANPENPVPGTTGAETTGAGTGTMPLPDQGDGSAEPGSNNVDNTDGNV